MPIWGWSSFAMLILFCALGIGGYFAVVPEAKIIVIVLLAVFLIGCIRAIKTRAH